MTIKASLKVALYAGDVLVAESEDQNLWHRVLAAMQAPSAQSVEQKMQFAEGAASFAEEAENRTSGDAAIDKLAHLLKINVEHLIGACAPSKDAPYIHLDAQYWEIFKKNTPSRGPGSVSPTSLAATALCLWFKAAEIGTAPTVVQCQDVLETIGIRDRNAARAIGNTDWLQMRQQGVFINPAQMSRAIRLLRAYSIKTSVEATEPA